MKIRRPTEERALSLIAREAIKRGITQAELLNQVKGKRRAGQECDCFFHRRRRADVRGMFSGARLAYA